MTLEDIFRTKMEIRKIPENLDLDVIRIEFHRVNYNRKKLPKRLHSTSIRDIF